MKRNFPVTEAESFRLPEESSLWLWLWELGTPSRPKVEEEELVRRAGLGPEEANTLATLSGWQRRTEWLAARVMAREKIGSRIGYDSHGRPFGIPVSGNLTPPHISLSHTHGYCALLVCESAPCGLDIEPLSRCAAAVARRAATPEERGLAEEVFPPNPELLVWCAKEAAYKITGRPGTDFKRDILLTPHGDGGVAARIHGQPIRLLFFTRDDLLIVCGRF